MLSVLLLNVILLHVSVCQVIGNACTIEQSRFSGKCKLLTDCKQIRDEILTLNRVPSTCGFQDTQPIVCCPPEPGVKSRQKCKEYSSFASEGGYTCHNIVKRIVGGVKAKRKEFPHMALVGFGKTLGNVSWLCGGTIISENYIMTTAHCLADRSLGVASYVQVGVTNNRDNDHKQSFKIEKVIHHPEYKAYVKYNDIGLLKLEKSIKFDAYARPACLYYDSQNAFDNVIATGWGATDYTQPKRSEDLLKVTLNIIEPDVCNATYKNSIGSRLKYGIQNATQICAGSEDDEKDTCQGDNGGPIQIYHEGDNITCMYDIVGITSFGKACTGLPAVYTRVSYYLKWIEETVWP